ncbi:MAG: xanthine dehydrogenase family protein molybdopterin-binding subunit [Bacillota bacterium]
MTKYINKAVEKIDLVEKVTGQAEYGADLNFDGMLFAKTVYSKYPHAEIIDIDISEVKKIEGVVTVLTSGDVPGDNFLFGHFRVLTGDKVRYVGDGVALVVAKTRQAAWEGQQAVKVKYKELSAVLSIDEALKNDAPVIHEEHPDNIALNSQHNLIKGDIEKGFAEADKIIEKSYESQFVEHGYIEPEAIVAVPSVEDDRVTVYGSIQNPFYVRDHTAGALGWPLTRVKIKQSTIGGTFGGKDEVASRLSCRAAIAAVKLKKPVQIVLSREESMLESSKRHPYRFNFKVGLKNDGEIVAMDTEVISQAGGYNKQSQFTNWRCAIHTTGPYSLNHINTSVRGVYTNTIYGGAMRGFSSPQNIFAVESLMDELAEEFDMDPAEFRLKNVLRAGDTTPSNQKLGDGIPAPLADMIEEVIEKTEYKKKRVEYQNQSGDIKKGIGLAVSFRGAGLGGEALDATGALLSVQSDGSISLITGLSENGQGLKTAHAQIVAEILGVDIKRVDYPNVDTSIIPDGGPTVASRGAMIGGKAVKMAADKVKDKMLDIASELLDESKENLYLKDEMVYCQNNKDKNISYLEIIKRAKAIGVLLTELAWFNPGPAKLDHATNQGEAFPTYAWAVVIAEVEVDTGTGYVDLKKVTSAHDVGTALNIDNVLGQIYGGVAMGQGMGIMEEIEMVDGQVRSLNLDEYLIPTSLDVPEVDPIIVETDDGYGPYGAKSLGEAACEVHPAAIVNAVYNATGRRIRHLPCNLERVKLGHMLTRKGVTE